MNVFVLVCLVLSLLTSTSAQSGFFSSNPAASCWHVKQAAPYASTGTYFIKPTNYAGAAFQGYCDMTTDGGGWLLVANQVPNNNDFSLTTPTTSSVAPSQSVNAFYAQTILNALATETSFYQVMVEEVSNSSPDKINGIVQAFRLNSTTTLKFAAQNGMTDPSPAYTMTNANSPLQLLTPNGYVTIIDNTRGSVHWWGLSWHGSANDFIAANLRCLKKNNFSDPNTGTVYGDYKLNHNPYTSWPGVTGTTRCTHYVYTYGLTHWFRPVSSSCAPSTISTPVLVPASSGIVDPTSLQLVFDTNPNRTATFAFVDQSIATCGNTAASTYWSSTMNNCNLRYTVTIPFNTALANCGFKRSEDVVVSGVSYTRFDTTISITSFQSLRSIRGVLVNSTLNTAVTVYVLINTAVNSSSSSLSIFGPRITLARITSQTVNTSPVIPVFTLNLFTSAQWPYQFITPSINSVTGFSASITALSSGACNPATVNQPCGQNWQITISRASACPTFNNIINSGWTVNFGVQCQTIFTGSCSTPSLNTDSITFDTASDDYCPRLLDSEGSTASLSVYSNSAFSTAQTQFVFGARSYFEAVVTSPIALASLSLERVSIVAGAAGGSTLIVYQNPFVSAATYRACDGTGCPTGNFMTFNNSITALQVTDNVSASGAGAGFFRAVRFSWIWSSQTSSANSDASVSTLVQVNLRLRYANQSTVSVPITIMSDKSNHNIRMLDNSAPMSATASVDVALPDNAVPADVPALEASSTTSGVALTSLNILAIVAAVVGMTALVVATVVGLRMRQQVSTSPEKSYA